MILSMYFPLFDGQTCIGYAGAGVFATHLTDALLILDIKGMTHSEYVFLNVENGTYLYHEDDSKLDTEVEDQGYLEIIDRIKSNGSTEAILCSSVAVVIILVTLLILYREGRELMVMERAISRPGNLELSADREPEPFYGRTDEIGMIAETIHQVCDCLRKTIEDIGRILGGMADGNIAVDVVRNEDYYNVTNITTQIQNSAVRCGNASNLVDKATGYAAEADTKMEQLITATKNIDESSAQIGNIIKTIEDSAAIPNELSKQAKTLNRLIGQFRIK